MISPELRKAYTPTIGIECHVQLKTATKLFAAVGNDAREAPANTLVSHICLGMPGALPVLNKQVIVFASRAAFAFNTKPQKYSIFERKHYFYPDLPKGYQITQLHQPIVVGGTVTITVDGKDKTVNLDRVQIEEDAGKSTHPAGADYSLVDLNRAGTPLLEIVSEPDIHSSEDAKAYARELWLLMRYAGVSDADLYYGNMRFDVNVSVSKDPNTLGIRTETKNINSFRSVEKTVEYEVDRQIALLEKGETITQETRGWDDAKQRTFSQRTKEDAHDYRYMPEPDVPPVVLDDLYISDIEKSMPTMPAEWRERLSSLGMSVSQVETLIEAELDDQAISYLGLLESTLSNKDFAKALANWLVNSEIPLRRSETPINNLLSNEQRLKFYQDLYQLIADNKLSSTNAKGLISNVLASGANPADLEKYAQEQGLIQVSDTNELGAIVEKVLKDNSKAADEVRQGEMKVIGFLVGQVMKASQGKANPEVVQQLIKKQLGL